MKISKNNLVAIILSFIFITIPFQSVYANDMINYSDIIDNTIVYKDIDGDLFNLVLLNEDETEEFINAYNNDSKLRNMLPNLVTFTYYPSYSKVTIRVTNYAVDSLDFLYGYVSLTEGSNPCGITEYRFSNIWPGGSEYITAVTSDGGYWDGGVLFADASDGNVSNNGVFFFSK